SADIATIDFTGSSAFGATLRQSARGRPVFTEEAGVNPVIIAGTSDFAGICNNLAMSLSLYSGQMCTSPQTMFIPKGGIDTDEGHKSASAVAEAVAAALDSLLGDPARALTILGAIQSPATLERVASAQKRGRLIRASAPVPGAKPARTATPALVEVEEASDLWRSECFGPIGFFIEVADAGAAVDRAAELVRDKGAITALIHATDDHLIDKAAAALGAAGVPLSVNLTGPILVNQSAAFSDYHVTGLNPSGNATLTDLAYVARRFSVAIVRRPAAA
ncbi:MAG: aldehyde dehydrogenase family protein, partial [Pseudomonadota bacterium]